MLTAFVVGLVLINIQDDELHLYNHCNIIV